MKRHPSNPNKLATILQGCWWVFGAYLLSFQVGPALRNLVSDHTTEDTVRAYMVPYKRLAFRLGTGFFCVVGWLKLRKLTDRAWSETP